MPVHDADGSGRWGRRDRTVLEQRGWELVQNELNSQGNPPTQHVGCNLNFEKKINYCWWGTGVADGRRNNAGEQMERTKRSLECSEEEIGCIEERLGLCTSWEGDLA